MLTLTEGTSSIVVAPEYGAGVVGWLHGDTAVLRRARPEAMMGNVHYMAGFPLLPYANRIAEGRFTWDGRAYTLAKNSGEQPNTIHGIGRHRAWDVREVEPNAVNLSLTHPADAEWPFALEATLSYALNGPCLTVAMSVTNRHASTAPAGLGFHPYFPKQFDAALRFNAIGVWQNGADSLPSHHGSVPFAWSYASLVPITRSSLDNCFTGWDRLAETTAGPASLRIEASEAFGNLQVFTPSWTDFFCVEPVTHSPGAINRPDLPPGQGMTVLTPGETLAGTIRLTLTRPEG
jgi:aldose 1-epimerase